MFDDTFKKRYTTIPFATYSRHRLGQAGKSPTKTLFHMHREIEIVTVLEGEMEAEIDAERYLLRAGDVVVVAPYALHRYTLVADRDLRHECLCFDAGLLFDPQTKEEAENGILLLNGIVKNDPICAGYIRNAFDAHAAQKDGWEWKVIGNLSLFFGVLKEREMIRKRKVEAKRSVYMQIYQYISEHFGEEITSADAAKALNISPGYFCRLFRKSFGESFQNYLCKFRIEQSMQLLHRTEDAISDVAMAVGFNSFGYYSKKFREYNGMTPKEYRKRRTL